jgi:hypothetical protein
MSNPASTDRHKVFHDDMGQRGRGNDNPTLPGALPFLLQPDPQAIIEVELLDQPVKLSHNQFEALLVDSECEV